jgi:hypothetical protein
MSIQAEGGSAICMPFILKISLEAVNTGFDRQTIKGNFYQGKVESPFTF